MINPIIARRVLFWGILLALSAGIIFIRILPLGMPDGRWPGPDWTLAIAFAWVLRRPNYIPVLLFAAILLLNDILFLRAPGLWTGLGVIALEFLRARARFSRELPFVFEWAMVAGVLLVMMLANRIILGVFIVTQNSFAMDSLLLMATVFVYPFVVMISALTLGVRQVIPGEVDQFGHRI